MDPVSLPPLARKGTRAASRQDDGLDEDWIAAQLAKAPPFTEETIARLSRSFWPDGSRHFYRDAT